MIDPRTLGRTLADHASGQADRLLAVLLRLGIGEHAILIGFALLVGATVGFGTLGFYRAIDVAAVFIGQTIDRVPVPAALAYAAPLALALFISRALVHWGTRDSDGENVADVIHAVARRGAVIRFHPVLAKSVAAAATLGGGGSVGAEGPAAVLGAGLGSGLGRIFRFETNRLRHLVGCGAAAGISSAFGAPIAGAMFAMEEVLGNFRSSTLAPVIVASVAGAAVTRVGLGEDLPIRIPGEYGVNATQDLVVYALIGLVGGLVGVFYHRGIWRIQDWMKPLPWWLRLGLSALVIGTLAATFEPGLWGRGHQALDLRRLGQHTALFLLLLSGAKVLATGLTLSGGGVGGVFMPALVVGAAFGGGVGVGLQELLPSLAIEPVACALVGMTAVVAGATHAPLTAIFLVLEITNDYELILPLMLAGAFSFVLARALHPASIYSEWLARRGERISHGTDEAVLSRMTVADAYRSDPAILVAHATLAEALPVVRQSSQLEFPVVDGSNAVVGVLTWGGIKTALADRSLPGETPIRELAQPFTEGVTLGDDLLTALRRLGARGAQMLPVVDRVAPHHLRGIIGRQEIFAAYEREVR
ncbi:MAG TPA: chloride channel protein [Gemmatimonadales bacterium]|nr:chloride channel protein [Gemmatimonadales bacterium]